MFLVVFVVVLNIMCFLIGFKLGCNNMAKAVHDGIRDKDPYWEDAIERTRIKGERDRYFKKEIK